MAARKLTGDCEYIMLSHRWEMSHRAGNNIRQREGSVSAYWISGTARHISGCNRHHKDVGAFDIFGIDALCIVQGDPQDWPSESVLMGGI